MKDLAGIGFNGKIGFAYVVNEQLSLGLSYTMPTTITYKNGKANMDMTAQLNDAFGKAVQGYMMQNPKQLFRSTRRSNEPICRNGNRFK
jgi:long-subunit fatty acid transport protein